MQHYIVNEFIIDLISIASLVIVRTIFSLGKQNNAYHLILLVFFLKIYDIDRINKNIE